MSWIILTLIVAAIAAVLCFAFFAARRGRSASEADVYRAQLSEVEQEEAAGLMSAEDARLARIEIKRRLAASGDRPDAEGSGDMRRSEQVTLVAVIACVCMGSVWLYTLVGTPILATQAPLRMGETAGMQGAADNPQLASVEDMVGRLEARLADNPQDAEGWRMLGWSQYNLGNFEDARAAYENAIALGPPDADTLSVYGEILVRLADGRITDQAVDVFTETLSIAPQDPRSRFLLGLRKDQDGDPEGAVADWLAMLGDATPFDDWVGEVRDRVREVADANGIALPNDFDAAPAAQPGPSDAEITAAGEMSDEDRMTMIQGMVDRLDARLREDPNDLGGWVQLIRSYRVLNQQDLAEDAYGRAQSAFAGDEQALSNLEIAAHEPLPVN